jgi:hypothetical protein
MNGSRLDNMDEIWKIDALQRNNYEFSEMVSWVNYVNSLLKCRYIRMV